MAENRLERGASARANVLGPEYVAARATLTTDDPVIREWRRYLVEEGWGGVWNRPGLPNKTRSLITLTALAIGGHWAEFELHLVGALRNGWTPAELGEAFIHLSSYVGYPVAVHAFRIAEPVFARADSVGQAEPGP
jgi:alkylhydroperoxidase/carboxymuconolactone decarboxylase family protein YurZ